MMFRFYNKLKKNKIYQIPTLCLTTSLLYFLVPNNSLYYQKEFKFFVYNTYFNIRYISCDKSNLFNLKPEIYLRLYKNKIIYYTTFFEPDEKNLIDLSNELNIIIKSKNNEKQGILLYQFFLDSINRSKNKHILYNDNFYKEILRNIEKDYLKDILFLYLINPKLKTEIINKNIDYYFENIFKKFPNILFTQQSLEIWNSIKLNKRKTYDYLVVNLKKLDNDSFKKLIKKIN